MAACSLFRSFTQQYIHAFWSIRDLDRRDNPERFGKNKGWLTLKHFQLRDGSILV